MRTDNGGFIQHPSRLCASSRANRREVWANLGTTGRLLLPPQKKMNVKHWGISADAREGVVLPGCCQALCLSPPADAAREESQMLRNLPVALLQLLESLRQLIKIMSCQKSIWPSSTCAPTARCTDEPSEPVLWLKNQVKNGIRITCVLVSNRTINCLRNWQQLAIVSTPEAIAW